MECKFQTWKSLNIRNGEDLKVVCIKKIKWEQGADINSPVSLRDTDTPSLM